MIGKTLAHFEVTALLGAGGMGEVWRAKDTRLDREVAIKLLPDELVTDHDRLIRFEREAKILAGLNHPNIATLFSLEESDDRRFLVMELVEGENLAQRLARGPLPMDEAIEVAAQVAEGLAAAHDQNVVHRDLKPANILLTPEGVVKILDFGLARSWAAAEGDSLLSMSPTVSVTATAAGVILGTAPYMSPEQARGRPVDRRTDLWALGVILWEMLTGLVSYSGSEFGGSLAISPDGSQLVFSAAPEGGEPRLLVRPLGSAEAVVLPGTENGTYPFWSPDGRWVAFFADEKLQKVNLAGSPPQVLCDAPRWTARKTRRACCRSMATVLHGRSTGRRTVDSFPSPCCPQLGPPGMAISG